MPIAVRLERPDDQDAVHRIHVAAHADGGVAADLAADLRTLISAGHGASLVAVDGDDVVANVMFTSSLLDAPRRLVEVQVLSPMSVHPSYQCRGIGSAVIERGIQEMTKQQVPLVFLEGIPSYYPRFGFAPAGRMGFRKPSLRTPDEAFQVLALAGYEPWMTGTLVYSEIFWRHDAVGLRERDSSPSPG